MLKVQTKMPGWIGAAEVHPIPFKIEFTDDHVHPGGKVTGNIKIRPWDPLSNHCMKVSLIREEYYFGSTKCKRKFYKESKRVRIDSRNTLATLLSVGHDFSFDLPKGLCPSYKTKTGRIKYYIEVKGAWSFRSVQKTFVVQHGNKIFLNPEDPPRTWIVKKEERDLWLTTTLSDNIIFPGQELKIGAQIHNQSLRVVRKIRFKLIRNTQYHINCRGNCNTLDQDLDNRKCLKTETKTLMKSGMSNLKIKLMQDGSIDHTMTLPLKLYPSFTSDFCKVTYKIQIKVYREKIKDFCPVVFDIPVYAKDAPFVMLSGLRINRDNFGYAERHAQILQFVDNLY